MSMLQIMDKVAIEAFLYSADFGEDNYLLASSSSSESEADCCCSEKSDDEEGAQQKRRKVEGFAETDISIWDDEEFKKNLRVSRATCEKITELLYEDFHSDHKGGWDKITPTKAAYILLWFLGTTESFRQIGKRFKITQSCAYNIVKVGFRNLSKKLDDFVRWPDPARYEEESTSFYEISKISGIVGAIGVSHIKILKPKEDEAAYLNAKNYHSIAVQGIVTYSCKFVNVCVCEGSLESVEILNKSTILPKVQSEDFGEYFLVGNISYPSLSWLVIPFQNTNSLSETQEVFNNYHGQACSVLHTAFSVLKQRFQRLKHLENRDVQFMMNCIQAACVVHNICIDLEDYCEEFSPDDGIFEYEGGEDEEDSDDGRKMEVFSSFLESIGEDSD